MDEIKMEDYDLTVELFDFLTNESLPTGVNIPTHQRPKLSKQKAFTIIWFLQEHSKLITDNIEMCCRCKELYDSYNEGTYIEKTGRCYCDNCRSD